MATHLPYALLFSLLLGGLSPQASGRHHPTPTEPNIKKNQNVTMTSSNPYKIFIAPQKPFFTSRADDIGRQQGMSSEQRKHLKERQKRFESLSPEEKKKLKETRKKFKQLPPGERKRLKQKWRNLPSEERNNIIQKKQKKSSESH